MSWFAECTTFETATVMMKHQLSYQLSTDEGDHNVNETSPMRRLHVRHDKRLSTDDDGKNVNETSLTNTTPGDTNTKLTRKAGPETVN